MNMLKGKINLRKQSINSIIVTMLCHSFCCLFPILGMLVGANISGIIPHTNEVLLIALNVLFILCGFYFVYFHKISKDCDHTKCNKTTQITYWIATVLSIALLIVSFFIKH